MKVGKQAEKKELTKKQRVNRERFKKAMICFIIAILFFIALLVFQTSVLKQESKTKIYRANSELLDNTEITADNFENFFHESYLVTDQVEEGAITSPEQAYGMFLNRDLVPNEVLTANKIDENLTNILDHMDKPIKLSFEASSVVNAVAGEIRKGDLVNIYCVYSEQATEDGLTDYVIEEIGKNVYIQGAYDGSATEIDNMTSERTDSGVENKKDSTSTTVFTICVPEEYENDFIMAGLKGNYILTKVLYPGDKVIFGTDVTYKETLRTGEASDGSTGGSDSSSEEPADVELATMDLVSDTIQSDNNGEYIKVVDANGVSADIRIGSDKIPELLSEILADGDKESLVEMYDSGDVVTYFGSIKQSLIEYNVKITGVKGNSTVEDSEKADESDESDSNSSDEANSSDETASDESTNESTNGNTLNKNSDRFRFVQYQKDANGDLIGILTDSDKDENGEYPYIVSVNFSDEKYRANVDGYDALKEAGFEDATAVQEYLSKVADAYKADDTFVFEY